MRTDALLVSVGLGSRTEVKEYIKKGRIIINGQIAKSPSDHVEENGSVILFDGKEYCYSQYIYYMLNKPAGYVSATRDNRDKTVSELINDKRELFPVGRLDKDTEGLLIMTNDGELAHKLLSPKKHVDKRYFARVRGYVTEEDIEAFRSGIEMSDFTAMPAKLEILNIKETREGYEAETEVTIREGKFHQIKRMFQSRGKEVIYLQRISMGGLLLDKGLKPGEYRRLTEEELQLLKGNG